MPQPSREPAKAEPHGNAETPSNTKTRRAPRQPRPPKPPRQPSPRKQAARDAREQRRANRQRERATRIPRQRRRAETPAGAPGKPLRGWRSWWATHELDRRYRRRRRFRPAARSQIGGGFPAMRRWGTLVSAGVLTLLLLTLFSGAIALGAQSLTAAIVAFGFFAGALAVGTAAQARAVYSDDPANTQPPLEDVADLRIDDITFADEPDSGEVSSVADLQRSFTGTPQPADSPPAAALEATTGTAAAPPPAHDTDDGPEAPQADAGSASSQDPDDEEDPDAAALPDEFDAPLLPPEVIVEDPDSGARETAAGEENSAAQPDAPNGAAPPPNQNEPDAKAANETGTVDATDPDTQGGSGAEVATEADDEEFPADTDLTTVTASSGATLSLLTAETPGTDLLTAYTASHPPLPPAAVRDVAATLIVSDLDRSIMFYTELLGLVEIDRAPDAVLLEAGFGRVLLWQRDDAPGAGDPVMHLTFEVGDIDTAYESLRGKGVRFTHPPVSALSGEVHKLRAASFLDPDGHGLALTELREH